MAAHHYRRSVLIALMLSTALADQASAQDSLDCPSQPCESISVRVLIAGSRTPATQASIFIFPAPSHARPGRTKNTPLPEHPAWQRSVTTDDEGQALIPNLPKQQSLWIVVGPGFDRHEEIIDLAQTKRRRPLKLFVEPSETYRYRTTVQTTTKARSAPTSYVFSDTEIRTLPGTSGDPLRALQNLPGLARAPARLGLLVIRGAPPSSSQVFLGGHQIPRAFHVLSLSSVFPTDILDTLRFVPSNFDAAYGNATGGIVLIEPRSGRRDGVHGMAELDLTGVSAVVEGPMKSGSFLLAAHRGYLDGVLSIVNGITERVTGQSDPFLLPSYYDYQALFDVPLKQTGPSLKLRAFGSGDRIRTTPSPFSAPASAFDFHGDVHRIDAVYRQRIQRIKFHWTPSFRFESNRFQSPVNASLVRYRRRRDYIVSLRSELDFHMSRHFSLVVGSDGELDIYRSRDETESGADQATTTAEQTGGLETRLGGYASASVTTNHWSLKPSLRVSAFSQSNQFATAVDPRLSTSVQIGERWQIDAGIGRYSQVRTLRESERVDLVSQGGEIDQGSVFLPAIFSRFDPEITFSPADQELTVRHAWHGSLGASFRLASGYEFQATTFGRYQDNAIPLVSDGVIVGYNTSTQTWGLETLVRKRLTKRFYGWIAYTLMWSQVRIDIPGDSSSTRPSDFDQRHNLIFVGSLALPRRWRIGASFRVVSGYPYTPVIGSIASLAPGQYTPILGATNAARLPFFHQLDFRVDKRWILKRAEVNAYFDIQNVYNRVNPEAIVYSSDYRAEVNAIGLPILPSLGLRIEF